MQMLKFLRRVFIILILLIIVFFIFRFVKPEATNRFVDKVRDIPTTVSSRFHREKKSWIVINGDTTSTSNNFEINENNSDDYQYDNEIYDEDNSKIDKQALEDGDNSEIKNSRLEELNKELDKIMASGENTNDTEINNTWDSNDIEITENTWNNLPSWFVVIDIEQPYTWETQPSSQTNTANTGSTTDNTENITTNTWNDNSQNNDTSINNNTSNNTTATQQLGDCGLSIQDCENLYRDLWGIEIN